MMRRNHASSASDPPMYAETEGSASSVSPRKSLRPQKLSLMRTVPRDSPLTARVSAQKTVKYEVGLKEHCTIRDSLALGPGETMLGTTPPSRSPALKPRRWSMADENDAARRRGGKSIGRVDQVPGARARLDRRRARWKRRGTRGQTQREREWFLALSQSTDFFRVPARLCELGLRAP